MRRTVQAIVCLLAVALPASPAWGRPPSAAKKRLAAAAGCADAGISPSPATLWQHARATRCMVNRARALQGLRPLRANGRLIMAASAHAGDMVAHAFFGHGSPSGTTPQTRARSVGYGRGRPMRASETIGWADGAYATPAELVRAWMESQDHRAILLSREYRDIGVGLALGAPGTGEGGVTVTAALGVRG
jgi:uncharacterized protein YkwD